MTIMIQLKNRGVGVNLSQLVFYGAHAANAG